MPAEFKEFKGDDSSIDFVWGVVCAIGSKRIIAMKLNGKETQFGAKHLIDIRQKKPEAHWADRNSITPALINTVIAYDGPAGFQTLATEIADAFSQGTWEQDPKDPKKLFQKTKVDFSKARVVPVMGLHSNDLFTGYSRDTVKLKAFLKGQPGASISIVIQHLDGKP